MAAGVPGADLIPPDAELFLGFTSTLKENLGPSRIANLETLGLARIPQGYFTHGTHMHLSHIHENLEAWYVNTAHADRVADDVPARARGSRRDAHGAAGRRRRCRPRPTVRRGYRVHGAIGHSGALQTASRLRAPPRRARRNGLPGRRRDPAARRLQHARQPVPLERRRRRRRPTPRPASTSSSSTRRATTSTGSATRWTASFPTGRRSPSIHAQRARASTASCGRPGARTSSFRPRAHRSFPLAELRA